MSNATPPPQDRDGRTARLRDERAAARGEPHAHALRAAVVEAMSDGVFVFDRRGHLVEVNAAACAMHGWSRAEMLAMDPRAFIHPEAHPLFERVIAMPVGEAVEGTAMGRRSDGSTFHARVHARALRIAGDEWVFAIVTDDTRSRELERELHHSQRVEAVATLAGGLAHDFNNLLSVILGYAELAHDQLDGHPVQSDLDAIVRAGERARRLVRQLLVFARNRPAERRTVDLNRLVTDLVPLVQRILHDEVDLVFRPAPTPCPIHADPAQVELILMNLVLNARDAMPRGGTLTLRVTSERDGARRFAVLEVTDTGHGIADADQERVFDPFYTTKSDTRSIGLGLAIVARTARQHDGDVQVISAPKEGATFRVRFPRSADTIDLRRPQPVSPRNAGARILVVDDETSIRALILRVLSRSGFQVQAAATAEDGLQLLAHGTAPHLLVTDVLMPGLDGETFVSRARALHPDLRALYVTGQERGHLPDDEAVLAKPFSARELVEAVDRALGP